ncbi:GspH/FimT family pseudopilin [Lentisalinibacter orientalis]|uniref:GspH/FimT family pseudopilin n=1 Tax=Lentisalinibacter orientalis TaxID=2992241 RepID=UPI0038677A16
MSPHRGYSLYELLVTLSVATILIVIGAPPLGSLIARNQLTAEINALHHALHFGRQEAIKRRLNLVLCQSADGSRCTGAADWGGGWMLFVDDDDDGRADPGEAVLRRHRPADAVNIITNRHRYTLRGVRKRNTNGTFLVCDDAGRVPARALIVSYTGRPRSAPGDDAPASLACPGA